MNENPVVRLFKPSEGAVEKLSFKEKNQLNFLIIGNLIVLITICLFCLIELIVGNIKIGSFALIGVAMQICSLTLIKKGNIKVAAGISTTALICVDTIVCMFGTARYAESAIIYRNIYFVTSMCVMNALMAVSLKQILIYDIVAGVIFELSNFTVTGLMRQNDLKGFIVAVVISTLAYILVATSLRNIVANNDRLLEKAKKDSLKQNENVQKIKKVVSESESGLKIGDALKSVANDAAEKSDVISEAFNVILPKIETLSKNVSTLESNIQVIQKGAGRMQETSENQARNVETTSSAMVQISANVTTISETAQKRKDQLYAMAEGVGKQKELAGSLKHQFEKVEEYSQVINGFVHTINKISEQTNLLAMNASIEAAHAGNLGKGFSVIAQEIRKLSLDTSSNAKNIEAVLQENFEVVKETVETMDQFNKYVESSGKSATETLKSIDEIISGIMEIDVGNKEINKSISEMVEGAKETTVIIDQVSTEIKRQIDPVKKVVEFMNGLREEVNHLNNEIVSIQNTLARISDDAETNAQVGENILRSLSEI